MHILLPFLVLVEAPGNAKDEIMNLQFEPDFMSLFE
jgi:hypothetical protein